jgi:serine/threonine-protein kinase
MALSVGTRLGPYEILAPIGAGGMGEVYRALDTKLRREVAIKVLPPAFAQSSERLARFEREAHVLASLNHPNIAAIYGLEEAAGVHHLVLELVPGETLAQRLALGALPVEEALAVCRQIADGLGAAHAKGVMHRDLKPANVMVMPDGKVKLLDFGLAKVFQDEPQATDFSQSPTLTADPTHDRTILGTAAYMSPEQARGDPLDKRTDVWSFGCVLYEALTGRHAFAGKSASDVLAAVLRGEPEWSHLPPGTPPNIARLLRRCLQKDPERRLHDIADARLEIDEREVAAPAIALEARPRRPSYLWLAAGLLAGAVTAGVMVWTWMRSVRLAAVASPATTRLVVRLPDAEPLALAKWAPLSVARPSLAISPDGTCLAYVAERNHTAQLLLRSMDEFEAKPVPGTSGAYSPFFSPDSRWIGFFAENKLKKVSVQGGDPVTLCETHLPFTAGWGADDVILFAQDEGRSLWRVPASGGAPQPVKIAETAAHQRHRLGEILPGGKAALIAARDDITMLSLESGEERLLVQGGAAPRYAASGHVVFVRQGSLWAVPFDVSRLQATGSPVYLLDGVRAEAPMAPQYTLASNGTLVYAPGAASANLEMVFVDRQGTVKPAGAPARVCGTFRLSPDGRRLAVTIHGTSDDIWIYDLVRGTFSRLTMEGSNDYPLWTPDGARVVFASSRGGPSSLSWMPADGSAEPESLLKRDTNLFPYACSRDGRLLAFVETNRGNANIWILPLKGDRRPQLFLGRPFFESQPAFSPDGRWIAYASEESGRFEVYVRPYPGPGGKRQVSTYGGEEPIWSADGRELFYRNGQKWMVAAVRFEPEFAAETPRLLFEGPYVNVPGLSYDVTPDGRRFLLLRSAQEETPVTQFHVVLNWLEELRRRAPAAGK